MSLDVTAGEKAAEAVEFKRYRTESRFIRLCVLVSAVGAVFLSAYMIFGLGNVFKTYVLLETEYFYVMLALLIPLVFLLFPFSKGSRRYLPWFDALLAAIAFVHVADLCLVVEVGDRRHMLDPREAFAIERGGGVQCARVANRNGVGFELRRNLEARRCTGLGRDVDGLLRRRDQIAEFGLYGVRHDLGPRLLQRPRPTKFRVE